MLSKLRISLFCIELFAKNNEEKKQDNCRKGSLLSYHMEGLSLNIFT